MPLLTAVKMILEGYFGRWITNKNGPLSAVAMSHFWQDEEREGTTRGGRGGGRMRGECGTNGALEIRHTFHFLERLRFPSRLQILEISRAAAFNLPRAIRSGFISVEKAPVNTHADDAVTTPSAYPRDLFAERVLLSLLPPRDGDEPENSLPSTPK